MLGLLRKDIINLGRYSKIVVGILIALLCLGIVNEDIGYISVIIPTIFCMILFISSFSYDEMAKWDKYALALPITRKDFVLSKYALAVILVVGSCLLSICLSVLTSIIVQAPMTTDLVIMAVTLSVALIIFLAVMIPILYKFGPEKARIWMFLVAFLPSILPAVINNFISKEMMQTFTQSPILQTFVEYLVPYGLPVLSILLLAGSYVLSYKIVCRKEY